MAKNEAKIKFTAETGEFNSAIKKANSEMSELRAELKLNETQMKGTGASVEALEKQHSLLESHLKASQSKTEALSAKVEKAAEIYGKNSSEVSKLKIQLTNAQTAEEKIKQAIAKCNSELEDQKQSAGNAEDALKKLGKETGNAKKDTEEFKKSVEEAEKTLDDAKSAVEDFAGGLAAIGGAAVAGGIAAITSANDTKSALNSLQAQTGFTDAEMVEYGEHLKEVFKGGYGESIEDVANTMAIVRQNTKLSGDELKTVTEYAFLMSDTFDFDVSESTRAASMLMSEFGISAEEAYNLIAQGAQQGLNKNGDLLDVINEYGVHYSNLGYSSEEFFNSLLNGASEGTFSVDKLGDAMKEFGIRVKDTGTASQDAFELLGYSSEDSSEEVTKLTDEIATLEKNLKYAKMEQAGFNEKTIELTRQKNADKIAEYSKKLNEAKKKLSEITSTSGKTGKSLKDIQKRFAEGGESAKEAAKEVGEALFAIEDDVERNKVGVGLFGTMWEDLGETAIAALLEVDGKVKTSADTLAEINEIKYDDLGTKFKTLGRTIITDVVNPIGEKLMPIAEEAIGWIGENLDEIVPIAMNVGTAIATIFVVNKVAAFTDSISKLTGVFSGLFTVISAHPIGAIVTALGLATTAAIACEQAHDKAIEKAWGLSDAEKALIEKIDAETKAIQDAKAARDEANGKIDAEIGHCQNLWSELQTIVNKNGEIKKGYEDRAAVITGLLSEALGIEISITDGVIQKYGELKASIGEVIATKRAEALLEASKGDYTTAIAKQADALVSYTTALDAVAEKAEEVAVLEEQLAELWEAYEQTTGDDALISVSRQIVAVSKELKTAADAHEGLNIRLAETETAYLNYANTIQNYEGVMAAVANGDVAQLTSAMDNLSHSFATADNATATMLRNQLANFQNQYAAMKLAVENGMPGVSAEQVEQMGALVTAAEAELAKLVPAAGKTGADASESFADALLGKAKTVKTAGDIFSEYAYLGIKSKSSDIAKAGADAGDDYSESLEGKAAEAESAATEVAESANSGMESVSARGAGENFSEGFASGIGSKLQAVVSAAKNLASSALDAVKRWLKIQSPSKEAGYLGEFFSLGFGVGIEQGSETAVRAAELLATNTLNALKAVNNGGVFADLGNVGMSQPPVLASTPAMPIISETLLANKDVIMDAYHYKRRMEMRSLVPTVAEKRAHAMEMRANSGLLGAVKSLGLTAEAIEDLANRPIVLDINGKKFALATAGDYDSVNGIRNRIIERGVLLD